jgi:hypothetical protein
MGRHGIERLSEPLPHRAPPGHDRWRRQGALTGRLRLTFTTATDPERWVSPGTGRLTLTGDGAAPVVALELARRRGRAILPGSGIKGAARTAFEIVTGSCDPFSRASRCSPRAMCPACAVFGRLGFTGRLSFGDADADPTVEIEVRKVPVPHDPDGEKTPGDVRLYDLRPAAERRRGERGEQRLPEILPREVATGTFAGTLHFWNLEEGELGAVLFCLGLSPEPGEGFALRLGGVKYHGQGAVRVALTGATTVTGALDRETLDEAQTKRVAAHWLAAGRRRLGAPGTAKLVELAAILGGGEA